MGQEPSGWVGHLRIESLFRQPARFPHQLCVWVCEREICFCVRVQVCKFMRAQQRAKASVCACYNERRARMCA